MSLRDDLARIVGSDAVRDSEAARQVYDGDAYPIERSQPVCIVWPTTTDQVAQLVRYCVAHEIPFTPRGAGTGLSGGAMPALGGVVISTKRMTAILDIDVPNHRLRAQSGIANKRISAAVAEHGLHFAPDPSSQTVSTLGGNIAENAGGPHTLKYGVTVRHILSATLVLPDGDVVELGRGVPGGPGLDLLGVVVGSEGTTGIVTEATVRLTPLPQAVRTTLAAFPSVRAATECVAGIISAGVIPAAMELMDRGILGALRSAFGLSYPEDAAALLLIECDGSPESVEREQAVVESQCWARDAIEVRVATSEAERQSLWVARKKGIGAMGRLAPTIVTHDGVIPRSQLPQMLDDVAEIAAAHGLSVANLFHAGDGNLHPCIYFDEREPGIVDRVISAGEQILRKCVELGGSVSGEHGIGVEKMDLLTLMFSPDDLEVQGRVKAIFNPESLGNPCKILPNQKGCHEHRMRWRGAAN